MGGGISPPPYWYSFNPNCTRLGAFAFELITPNELGVTLVFGSWAAACLVHSEPVFGVSFDVTRQQDECLLSARDKPHLRYYAKKEPL